MRLVPRSLVGRTVLVLIVGLSASHLLSMAIYSGDRFEALTMAGGRNMASRIASVTHMIGEVPAQWRERIAAGLDEPTFRVSLSRESAVADDGDPTPDERRVAAFIAQQSSGATAQIRVKLSDAGRTGGSRAGMWMDHMAHMTPGAYAGGQAFAASVQLGEGSWLNFTGPIPPGDSLWSSPAVLSWALMAIAIILLSVWVVRRLTAPLRQFASAAERLGRDVNAPPLPESGPEEVRQAALAFNEMQGRLRRMIENRTHVLGAISHDLRTPITLLRLRAEMLPEGEDRERMLGTLDEMEAMIAATLAFARDDAWQEEVRVADLAALIASVCDDMTDIGADVALDDPGKLPIHCRPVSLRRAVLNVIDNAIKYGQRARVAIERHDRSLEIVVDDDGPGIPEAMQAEVFAPFVRVEQSRSRDTGGVGLGLSVVQSVVDAHGGEVTLANRPVGGLQVRIRLPL